MKYISYEEAIAIGKSAKTKKYVTVVNFLDKNCEACKYTKEQFERLGTIDSVQVFAIDDQSDFPFPQKVTPSSFVFIPGTARTIFKRGAGPDEDVINFLKTAVDCMKKGIDYDERSR